MPDALAGLAASAAAPWLNASSDDDWASWSLGFAGNPFAEGGSYEDVARVLRPVALELSLDQRVQELLRLVQSASGMPRAAE